MQQDTRYELNVIAAMYAVECLIVEIDAQRRNGLEAAIDEAMKQKSWYTLWTQPKYRNRAQAVAELDPRITSAISEHRKSTRNNMNALYDRLSDSVDASGALALVTVGADTYQLLQPFYDKTAICRKVAPEPPTKAADPAPLIQSTKRALDLDD